MNTPDMSGAHRPRLDPMMTGTSCPLDLVSIRATIRRALVARPSPPDAAEVEEITEALRGHLEAMIRRARELAGQLSRENPAWGHWQHLISQTRACLSRPREPGLQDTRLTMQKLGRCARFLADCLDE
ncbi:DUF6415 family natural product biosynthesis protein [Streptomyces roseoverticillatus]|uniref:DUF6415 family natural product biosynthesis protein n=1 Tax=Streptomyces roseoverticillatus TaxID=66429 RepID=UPI003405490B